MNKALTLFTILLLSHPGITQPTVSDDIIPVFLDSIHLIQCQSADFQENASGANQTWDFSGLQPDPVASEYYFKFFDPKNTPFADRYPLAELAAINPDSQYVYYQLDNGILQLIGAVAEVPMFGTAFSDYNNAETEEVFPILYGDTWSDQFDGINTAGGFSVPFNGSIDGEVDAYGTLTLPSGTFDKVLRIKQNRTSQITGAPVSTSTLYHYVSQEYGLWLLSMEKFPSGPPLIYYRDSPEIISALAEQHLLAAIDVVPNPLQTGEALQINTGGAKIQQLQLYNSLGEKILLSSTPNGNSSVRLSLPDYLPAGTYFLYGQLDNGFFSKPLILVD